MDTHAVNTDVPALARLQQRALIVGVLGLAAGAIGAVQNPDQFFRSWLIGFMFCLGLSLGSLALLMLQHMSGGQWGLVGRRVFEAASRNLPFVALMFVPMLFGLPRLYVWARPEAVQADHILQMKAPYLNVPFFIARAVLYFAIWIGMAWTAEQLVGGPGSRRDRGDTRRFAPLPRGQRAGLLILRPHDDVRVDRLDHVARPALVLDDLRVHLRRRPGAGGVRAGDRRARRC